MGRVFMRVPAWRLRDRTTSLHGGEAMTATTRRWVLAASLIVATALGTGCNLLQLPFFLLAPEPKKEASLKRIASDDKHKEVSLVLVAYNGLEIRPELIQADRQLTELLGKHLR